MGQWTLTYIVGSYGIDEGGTIKISQRFASDWQASQFDRPQESGYTTVSTNGPAKLRARYDTKAHERPWMKCIVIDVYDGSLAPGDIVTIVLGDQSQGSPGIRAQSFQESNHEFRVLVDPTNACLVRRLPTSPIFPIIADEATEIVCHVPTQAVVGEAVGIFVEGRDRWGNPTGLKSKPDLQWKSSVGTATKGKIVAGKQATLIIDEPGTGYVIARCGTMSTQSNALTALPEQPRWRKYWGDLHAQSDATVGTGTEEEYFRFGRDHAHLDIMSHQGNDFQMTDEDWDRLNQEVRQFHQDGKFVVFPGFEWSANTPAGGDRNVIYLEEDQPILRSSHWQVPEIPESELTPAHPADQLYAKVRKHLDPSKVLIASHIGGRYADIKRYYDQELNPLIELVSCWGIFEWLLWDAFDMGYQVGVVCNSDGHKGRPGAEGPGAGQFGIGNGLTCVLAEKLSRASVFEALKSRRCYGTTGPRIDLNFEISGHPMGSSFEAKTVTALDLRASAHGATTLEALQLYRGREIVATTRPKAFDNLGNTSCLRLSWGGARIRGRGRRVVWDGNITAKGTSILQASTFAFDSPSDGILKQDEHHIEFRSRTTGDTDGIELRLSDANCGTMEIQTPIASLEIDLSKLGSEGFTKDLGGIEMHLSVTRYPETIAESSLSLESSITPVKGQTTPYFIKVIQSDGHLAWSSPIYVTGT